MALRNISYCLRSSNRKSLFRIQYPFINSASYFSSFNIPILHHKIDFITDNRSVNSEFRKLRSCYNPIFITTRSFTIEGPEKRTELNKRNNGLHIGPLESEEIAKVVQEVQNSALKAAKSIPIENISNEVESLKTKEIMLNGTKDLSNSEKKDMAQSGQVEKESRMVIMWNKVKVIAKHNFYAFRLFVLETKVSGGILINIARGHPLTRRERKQLVRTVADLCRLVPFIIFLVVPLLELLLPLYLKFFPFMMPSTFHDKSKEAEKTHKLLKVKLEMAKFLQETLDETINAGKYKSDGQLNLETFNHFMKDVRQSGHMANTGDILKFSKLFEDEVTLESLDHQQVKALCKLLGINSIGPKALLNFHLRMKVYQLKIDDKMIMREGISKIPTYELQQVCRERGMRAMGVSEDRLRFQLQQWLKMSIEHEVPISLLLLSRTMYLPDTVSVEEQLKETLLQLPDSVSKEASLLISSATAQFDNQTMFEVIREEAAAIRDEKEIKRLKEEMLVDKAPIISLTDADDLSPKKIAEDESISASDLAHLETAIESMAGSQTSIQEEELEELKEETADLTESIGSSITGANKLSEKLQAMIKDMDGLLDKLDVEKEKLHKTVVTDMKASNIEEDERMVAIEDLMKTLKHVKSVSHDEGKWRRILEMLDEDHDGHIEVHHLTEVMDLVDSEDIKLTSKEIERVLDVIDKEEEIEKQEDLEDSKRE